MVIASIFCTPIVNRASLHIQNSEISNYFQRVNASCKPDLQQYVYHRGHFSHFWPVKLFKISIAKLTRFSYFRGLARSVHAVVRTQALWNMGRSWWRSSEERRSARNGEDGMSWSSTKTGIWNETVRNGTVEYSRPSSPSCHVAATELFQYSHQKSCPQVPTFLVSALFVCLYSRFFHNGQFCILFRFRGIIQLIWDQSWNKFWQTVSKK